MRPVRLKLRGGSQASVAQNATKAVDVSFLMARDCECHVGPRSRNVASLISLSAPPTTDPVVPRVCPRVCEHTHVRGSVYTRAYSWAEFRTRKLEANAFTRHVGVCYNNPYTYVYVRLFVRGSKRVS